jgi:hypothetical protein
MGFVLIANEKYNRELVPAEFVEPNRGTAPRPAVGTTHLLPLYIITPIG